MAKGVRGVYITDDDFYDVVKVLQAEPLFKKLELTDLFAIALLYGKNKGYRTSLIGDRTIRIKRNTLENSNLYYLMMAIAVDEADSFDILAKDDDYFTICEEYAKTGFYALEEDYNKKTKKLLSKLEMEALRFFDSEIDKEEKSE